MDVEVSNQIRLLKSEAIQLKRDGRIDEAKLKLKEAQALEYQYVDYQQVWDVILLKKLAVNFKRQGDLESAKKALVRAKLIESGELVREENNDCSTLNEDSVNKNEDAEQVVPVPSPPPPNEVNNFNEDSAVNKKNEDVSVSTKPLPPNPKEVNNFNEDSAVNKKNEDVSVSTKPLPPPPRFEDVVSSKIIKKEEHIKPTTETIVTQTDLVEYPTKEKVVEVVEEQQEEEEFTDEELLDVETLRELVEVGGEFPDRQVYERRILFFKKKALAFKKSGDIDNAKKMLQTFKKLELACESLHSSTEKLEDEEGGFLSDEGEGDLYEDPEMIAEMHEIGMGGPSPEDLRKKSLEKKQEALKFKKSGNIDKAKECLTLSKKLENNANVLEGLLQNVNTDHDGDLMDDELNNGGGMELSLQDMMDPDLLVEMQAIGVTITPEEILEKAKERKLVALQHKKKGDLANAKEALKESKILEMQAKRLEEMLATKDNLEDDGGDDLEALEKQIDNDSGGFDFLNAGNKMQKQKQPPETKMEIPKRKTAEELKQEAFALRKADKIKEATQVFKQYKAMLQEEKLGSLIGSLKNEINMCEEQVRLGKFYKLFGIDGNSPHVTSFIENWAKYKMNCLKILDVLEKEKIEIPMERKIEMKKLEDTQMGFVETHIDCGELRLEIGFVGLIGMDQNQVLKKEQEQDKRFLEIHIDLGLPKGGMKESNSDEEKNIFRKLGPISPQQYEDLFIQEFIDEIPRDDSRQARAIVRRMQRRKIEISIHMVSKKDSEKSQLENKGGFFSSIVHAVRGKDEDSEVDDGDDNNHKNLVGKVVVELKHFLESNALAGDFDLMDKSNRKPMGGKIQFGIRTGKPFAAPPNHMSEGNASQCFQKYLGLHFQN